MAAIREAEQLEPGEVIPVWDLLEPGEIRNYGPFKFQPSPVQQSGELKIIQPLTIQPCWGSSNQSQNLQEGTAKKQDENGYREGTAKQQDEKNKTLPELLTDLKNTLIKEREEFAAKFKRQSRKVRDLEMKDKFQQNEIKEQKNAREIAENMWKKTDEEKVELNALMRSIMKEGYKINRRLKKTEAELSKAEQTNDELTKVNKLDTDKLYQENVLLQAKLEDHLRFQELNIETIHGLEDKVAHYKSAYQKATKSLTQQSELWKNKLKENRKEKEQVEKEKAALSQKIKSLKNKYSRRGNIIQNEKAAKAELQEELVVVKKEKFLLIQEVGFLKQENYNIRYYGGVMGRFRRIKRCFARIADRLFS